MADIGGSGLGAGSDRVAAAHQALLRDTDLQFDFEAVPPPPELPEWLRNLFAFLGRLQPVFEILFWAGIAILAGLILYFIVREVVRHRRNRAPAGGNADTLPDWRPPVARARALLSEVDRLAAEQRFAEAIHLLLFRSIEDIDSHRPGTLKPALTSRDIVGLKQLPASARQALTKLVATVEWSFFGGRGVDAKDFAECRRAYEAFAFPEAWREQPT